MAFEALERYIGHQPPTAEVTASNHAEFNNTLIYDLDYKPMFKRNCSTVKCCSQNSFPRNHRCLRPLNVILNNSILNRILYCLCQESQKKARFCWNSNNDQPKNGPPDLNEESESTCSSSQLPSFATPQSHGKKAMACGFWGKGLLGSIVMMVGDSATEKGIPLLAKKGFQSWPILHLRSHAES